MEPTQQGPEMLRKSAFRVRTKLGSAQGARPAGAGLESTDNSLSQSQLKPMTKLEDRKKLPGLTRLTNPAKPMGELIAEGKDGTLPKEKNVLEDLNEQQEEPAKPDSPERPDEQNVGFNVQSFKSGKGQAGLKQTMLKMNKIYAYEDLEIFATRFSPDDACVAVGLSDGRIEIKQLAGSKKTDSFQTSPEELPVSHIRWKSSKRIIASNVEGYLIEYDTQECRLTISDHQAPRLLVFEKMTTKFLVWTTLQSS